MSIIPCRTKDKKAIGKLFARIIILARAGKSQADIAKTLNREGYKHASGEFTRQRVNSTITSIRDKEKRGTLGEYVNLKRFK